MLRIENLNTGYGKKQVLYDISLEVQAGDIALIIGSNGSGKSTLLKSIFGINPVWSGKVYFNHQDITNHVSHTLLKKGLLYIPQKNNVFDQLTVKENLEISGMALNSKLLYKQRLEWVSNYFPVITSHYKMYPMKMSGGERQQLVLAMAMIHQPKLLMIDEPFTGLAPSAIEGIRTHLKQINTENNTTILMVEHRITKALPVAKQVIGLKLGNIVRNSTESNKFTSDFFQQILI